MFETDDFDQALSQLDLPEECNNKITSGCTNGNQNNLTNLNEKSPNKAFSKDSTSIQFANKDIDTINKNLQSDIKRNLVQIANIISPKHCKRKLIKSHFDLHCKRKFPGPAGLLTGSFEEYKDENVGHIEVLSQDIDFSQNSLQKNLFESTIWNKLLQDLNIWNLKAIENIKTVKQLAVNGNLKCRKAQTITAFVESVDRSAMDPLVTLRDLTGNIKCTLHRDAWSHFSSYIVPECCALILCKPTVLTTGSAFKKHYLNITLGNILAIYSSIILQNDEESLPDGYKKITNEGCTVFKMERTHSDLHLPANSEGQVSKSSDDFFEDLDNVFSDEIF